MILSVIVPVFATESVFLSPSRFTLVIAPARLPIDKTKDKFVTFRLILPFSLNPDGCVKKFPGKTFIVIRFGVSTPICIKETVVVGQLTI